MNVQDVVVRNGKKKLNVVVRSHEIDHTARPCLDGLGFEILKFALILTCIMCSLQSKVMLEILQHLCQRASSRIHHWVRRRKSMSCTSKNVARTRIPRS